MTFLENVIPTKASMILFPLRHDFLKESRTEFFHLPLLSSVWHILGMSYLTSLESHTENLVMTFPWKVIPIPQHPYDLIIISHTCTFFIFTNIHAYTYISPLFLLDSFSSFWTKNLPVTNYKSKSSLVTIFRTPISIFGLILLDIVAVLWVF